jgi:hypothetical protein
VALVFIINNAICLLSNENKPSPCGQNEAAAREISIKTLSIHAPEIHFEILSPRTRRLTILFLPLTNGRFTFLLRTDQYSRLESESLLKFKLNPTRFEFGVCF